MSRRRLWIALLVLAVLTPLGLWLPEHFRAGDAWGEWSLETVRERTGSVPEGMAREAGRWHAPAPDYAPAGWQHRRLRSRGAAYLVSALAGVGLCAGLMWLVGRRLAGKEPRHAP